jgi:hypothetical protein
MSFLGIGSGLRVLGCKRVCGLITRAYAALATYYERLGQAQ